jgi:hypothetical protein
MHNQHQLNFRSNNLTLVNMDASNHAAPPAPAVPLIAPVV